MPTETTEGTLSRLYLEASDEYNASSLARDSGFYHDLNEFTLIQLREVTRHLPAVNGIFLDIGTGSGIVPRVIRRLGVRSITVDWPVTGTEQTVASAREADVEGYYCHVGEDPLPLGDGSVDCVLLADVIEHLPHSPRPVLADIFRVLKRGGACVASTPNALRLTVRVKVPLGYSNWPSLFDYYDAPFHGGHHHEYTIEEFRETFRRAGFIEETLVLHEKRLGRVRIQRLDEISTRVRREPLVRRPMSPLFFAACQVLRIVTKLLPRLRSEMLIVARKP